LDFAKVAVTLELRITAYKEYISSLFEESVSLICFNAVSRKVFVKGVVQNYLQNKL